MANNNKIFVFYLLLALAITALPARAFVSSVRSVLGYIFVPPLRAAYATTEYFSSSYQAIQDLLNAADENARLKTEILNARVYAAQMDDILAENARLASAMDMAPHKRWRGEFSKIIYRDPNRWNTVALRKRLPAKSAVLGISGGVEALVGEVIEDENSASAVLLINDPDFSATAYIEGSAVEGLLTGAGSRLTLKFIPLDFEAAPGAKVFTSPKSVLFPQGILIGYVEGEENEGAGRTSKTLYVRPAVRPQSVKEVFVITNE